MRRPPSWMVIPAVVFAAACTRSGDRARGGADTTAADTTAAARPSGNMAVFTVLYHHPKDTAAFERYYRTTHLPLVMANQQEFGIIRADLTKFVSTADGKKPTYYRQGELYFKSMEDLRKGIATPAFKKVADDNAKFATGGLTGMIASATNTHESGELDSPAAILTVIYKTPKDSAAFEKYYSETHLPLVTSKKGEIGFERAELTRFVSNLDGSPPARYRQAELYFPSLDAVKKGIATPGFKQVADDLPRFASGGLDALIGVETR
jgi:uncharacterized protein (TIGR02118 family)